MTGVTEELVREVSKRKGEPEWMLQLRLKGLAEFQKSTIPRWIDPYYRERIRFDELAYYVKATEGVVNSWEEVPEDIRKTLEGLGIREAEQKFLAGLSVQVESEAIYESVQEDLRKKGVSFMDLDTAVKERPSLVQQYFSRIMPPSSNIFAALNTALWSGGVFIHVPRGVEVTIPLQSYFRITKPNLGQLEHTLIILEEGASVHYIEGCSAPIFSKLDLHAGVVEAFVGKGATLKFTTIQNWSKNVINVGNKRAVAMDHAVVDWVDANLGSGLNLKYPTVILSGPGASARTLSLSLTTSGQVNDSGARMIHLAPDTRSTLTSKSVVKGSGKNIFRGMVRVAEGAEGVRARSRCDTLILSSSAVSDTEPVLEVFEPSADVGHEATVTRLGDDQLFYLMSRGLTEQEATYAVVNGFVSDFVRTLPMEYALEMNRLIELEMKGAVG